jgi:two-component system nitrate/nitrite response regulator NarL
LPATAHLRVLLADDHPVYRDGVVAALRRRSEFEVVAQLGEGRAALEQIRELQPDVAVLDLQMPGLDGIGVANAVAREDLPTRTLILSAYFDRQTAYQALAAGAVGVLSKDASGIEIGDAILAVARGETVLGADVQAALAEQIRHTAARGETVLSERETEVLRFVADGLSAPEIAARLHLGTTTVKTHLGRIYEKLGVTDRAAAVAEGMRRNLLQ